MSYKNKVNLITVPLTPDNHKKLEELVISMKEKSKTQLSKKLLEEAINGYYNKTYQDKPKTEQ